MSYSSRVRSTPANAITSARSVVRGRWKFVSSASTRRNAKPGVMKRSDLPSSGAPSRERLQHPGRRRADGEHALSRLDARPHGGVDPVALAVQLVLLDRLRGERPERVEPDVERDPLVVELPEELGREVQARRRSGRRPGVARVDRLIPLGVGGRHVDVGRERQVARGLPLDPYPPPAVTRAMRAARPMRVCRRPKWYAEPTARPR